MFINHVLLGLFYVCTLCKAFQDASQLTSGPFKTKLLKSEACKFPTKPYEKDPAFYFNSVMSSSGGKTLLNGNLTVFRVVSNFKVQARGFLFEDGRWKIMYMANSVGCHGLVLRIIKFAFNVGSYNQACIPKGTYTYKDLDFNSILQSWAKSSMYGRFLWRVEIISKAGTTICWEYLSHIEPIGK